MADNNETNKIQGVEVEIVEGFLKLFRESYEATNDATHFLEQQEGVSNVAGITNMRDALSHFVSALNSHLTLQEKRDQVTNAEEHIRRAIVEPYQMAIDARLEEFRKLHIVYKKKVLPVRERHTRLSSAPNGVQIKVTLEEVNRLYTNIRNTKRMSLWDERWREHVANLINGYEKLRVLYSEIETALNIYEQMNTDKRQTIYFRWAMVATVTSIILTILLSILS